MKLLLEAHWPWWLGALALAGVAALMWIIERRLLAVSGSFGRLVTSEDAKSADARRLLDSDPNALEAALLAATLEEFGDEAELDLGVGERAPPQEPQLPMASRLPWTVHLAFLAAMAIGGAAAAWLAGSWQVRFDLGETYSALVGSGTPMLLVLLVGGMLTGFGTRMSGGCTSGHGLTGCARLQPGSLVATAAFFGTAIAISFLLAGGGG